MQPHLGLNFAYGSNLDRSQLPDRCPNAVLEGPVILCGYRLEFFGAADLEPHRGGTVPAVAWRLEPDDEERLDRHEGVGRPGREDSYVKTPVTAHRPDRSTVDGYIYLMTPRRRARDPREPRTSYYARVASGYRDFGFDERVLTAAFARARGAV